MSPPSKCKIHNSRNSVLLIAVSPIPKAVSGPEWVLT